MASRIYQAYGLTYSLRSECALEAEDFAKLATLAKLEKQAQETRLAIIGGLQDVMMVESVGPLAQALERQEARVKRLRGELKKVLA